MINIILAVVGVILVILLWNFLTGKGKPSDRRTSMEKIACALFSIFRMKVKDVEHSVRSARVMKEEAMQEVEDAIRRLKTSYTEGQQRMRIALKKLKDEILPRLNDQPGVFEGKARQAKKKFESTGVEAYKTNAMKYLQYKAKAVRNIDRCKENVKKLEFTIETSKANYEGNIADLEMIKSELETMIDIPQVELNQSLERIRSLQGELETAVNEATIRAEVQEEMNAQETAVINADIDQEFNAL